MWGNSVATVRPARSVDRLDLPVLGCGEHQPAVAEPQIEPFVEVDAGLANLVEPRDAGVCRAVGDVLGDVGRPDEQDRDIGVDGRGVELTFRAVLEVEARAFEEPDRRIVEAALVGHGEAHARTWPSRMNCLSNRLVAGGRREAHTGASWPSSRHNLLNDHALYAPCRPSKTKSSYRDD